MPARDADDHIAEKMDSFSKVSKDKGDQRILRHFDCVIWVGDFNYRICASGANTVMKLMENDGKEDWKLLEAND